MLNRKRHVGIAIWPVLTAAGLGVAFVHAQSESDGASYTPDRTPWDEPDIQGIWSPGYILTPMERPEEFADQEFLTDEDVAALEERASVPRRDLRAEAGTVADVEGAYNEAYTGTCRRASANGWAILWDPGRGTRWW